MYLKDNIFDDLIQQLQKMAYSDGKSYEDLCIKIIHHLFYEHFYGWNIHNLDENITKFAQNSTDDEIHKRDLIVPIHLETVPVFWKFVLVQLNCRYITFEFKNYAKQITQEQVYTTEKYLHTKAFRTFAIIFSRKGANQNAQKAIHGVIRENGKYILVLDDDDVIKMLNLAKDYNDATDLLFDKLDNLLMKLPR